MMFSCLQEEHNPAYEPHNENLLSTNVFLNIFLQILSLTIFHFTYTF
jgi:hypothetical protein